MNWDHLHLYSKSPPRIHFFINPNCNNFSGMKDSCLSLPWEILNRDLVTIIHQARRILSRTLEAVSFPGEWCKSVRFRKIWKKGKSFWILLFLLKVCQNLKQVKIMLFHPKGSQSLCYYRYCFCMLLGALPSLFLFSEHFYFKLFFCYRCLHF